MTFGCIDDHSRRQQMCGLCKPDGQSGRRGIAIAERGERTQKRGRQVVCRFRNIPDPVRTNIVRKNQPGDIAVI
jgi:hypothetical protein